MSQEMLIMIYRAYFYSLVTYGILCRGNSSYSIRMFRLKGKILRTVTNSKNRGSCRNLLKNLNIFTFVSQYIFLLLSLSLLTANNILQIQMFMAVVPNVAPIFIEQYHRGSYQHS